MKIVRHRWSKLQTALYQIIDPNIKFQIHCVAYPMRSKTGYANDDMPRYWITIGKKIIWDYPQIFTKEELREQFYPWMGDTSDISCLIREYIDCPDWELLTHSFEDRWHLVPILIACDKRIGKRRLTLLLKQDYFTQVHWIIRKRLGTSLLIL